MSPVSAELERNQFKSTEVQPFQASAYTPKPGYEFIKRVFDIVVSSIALVLLGIPMLFVALVIKLDSHGPVLFRQQRWGKNSKVFTIYKFRTMRTDAPRDMASRDFSDSDHYITRLGAFLRKTSIDELPQLLNIIKGDMSLVGYRPVCLTEEYLHKLRESYGVMAVRPGLTGYAQVLGRDNIDCQQKARLDGEYVANRSVKLDLWCVWKTFATVISGEGVK